MRFSLKTLGPGLLFAGAAIGVSHLVQSTRAGAEFGFGFIWALLLINVVKYPFFQFGPRYALATGESLLDGYKRLGKPVLIIYFILTFLTMFTIQTAVTIVTAGLASSLFGNFISVEIWTIIILAVCLGIVLRGRYKFLDQLMKIIVIMLTVSTIIAVFLALKTDNQTIVFTQIIPENASSIGFLIAFMGWMPAPLDVSIWQSLWAIEKHKDNNDYDVKSSLFDFNVGFIAAIFVGLGFIALGTLVMFNSGETLSDKASVFANQLISMYTEQLGNWSYIIIGIAAFTTMFSTTLTTLDASPRAMHKTTELLFKKKQNNGFLLWVLVLVVGTISIFLFLKSEMGFLIELATILSFVTAPFYAIANYKLITSKHTPKEWRPTLKLHVLSWIGILFLIGFSIWYLLTL
ncbi:Nramp family divalent metal transporter [Winogradskyella sp. SYSU M77433]|uniref:Nramp family divalent metal transporter n=1 Tax=Winogradskyella sp. SYSU M77433 TaxID=3042722 RepID=UPI0024811F8E|nr:Nramp family divalent metal transporter [Winogradskyella sp. SYSU M77433]MDH7911422.1 Nramp family divalent metal transporter [Winogradskyella sp. SYSU M77433]